MSFRYPDDDPPVPNAPIRQAFEESGMTISEVADRMYGNNKAVTRVGRLLGIYPEIRGERKTFYTQVSASKARQLLATMHLDPVDVGL